MLQIIKRVLTAAAVLLILLFHYIKSITNKNYRLYSTTGHTADKVIQDSHFTICLSINNLTFDIFK